MCHLSLTPTPLCAQAFQEQDRGRKQQQTPNRTQKVNTAALHVPVNLILLLDSTGLQQEKQSNHFGLS